MPKESHLELKVGAVVVLGFALLAMMILAVGDFTLWQEGTRYDVVFGFANGVKKAAPVRIAGVDSGLVRDVRLVRDDTQQRINVIIEIHVNKGILIPEGSTIMINQLGLFGEKYIEIVPGPDTGRFVKGGTVLTGQDPVMQEKIAQKIMDVAVQLEEGAGGLKAILNDEQNRVSISGALSHINSLSDRFDRVMLQVEQGQGTIGRLLYDDALYNELDMLAADLKENPWKLLYKPKDRAARK